MSEIVVKFAILANLDFVRQDRYIPPEVVKRKIEWQEVIIAEQNGYPVGYLRLEYLWSLVPYIALIYVQPDRRRQGIGRALLSFIEDFLRDQGHQALYSSSQANEAMPQAWHRHVGFEECGFIAGINEDGIGEVFFRKQLILTA